MKVLKALTLGILVSTLAATSAQAGTFFAKLGEDKPRIDKLLGDIKERKGSGDRSRDNKPRRDFSRGDRDRGRDHSRFRNCGNDKPPKKNVPELDGGSAGIALGLLLSLVAMRRERNARKQRS